MLQIVQGRYFRNVPLTDTVHRSVFFTNLRCLRSEAPAELMFGRLLPSTTHDGVATLTVEARERLETLTRDGRPEVLIATSGDQLIDEIAAVTAFFFNAICVRDYDQARRLISRSSDPLENRTGPASILRQTFDTRIWLDEPKQVEFDLFLRRLTALDRKSYEAAMRAVRQIVDATLMVEEDATLAYTLLVAALESLAQARPVAPSGWSQYDAAKRARIDRATDDLNEAQCQRIREAILENEYPGLQRRFVTFVLGHIEPSFYRSEAIDAVRPIAAVDLPSALQTAYRIRSRNVHALQDLPAEVWMMADRADTADLGDEIVLSLEGLARLARHVTRHFVERSPIAADDEQFDYRSALPGIMRVKMAAQYWIHAAEPLDRHQAPSYLNGMLDYLIEGLAGRSETLLVDMSAVMAKIAKDAPGLAECSGRSAMSGMVTIWNALVPEEMKLSLKGRLAKIVAEDMARPSIVSFAIPLLLGREIAWPLPTLEALATERWEDRQRSRHQPFPRRLDAALHLLVADKLRSSGEKEKMRVHLARAVETVPGNSNLIAYEEALLCGEDPPFDLMAFILFGEQGSTQGDKIDPPADKPR